MAQTALTKTTLKQNNYAVQAGDLSVTMNAIDTVNGNSFVATGKEVLIFQNTDATPHTVTITSVADSLGRTGDVANYSIAAGAIVAIEMSQLSGWLQTNGNVNISGVSNLVKVGVLLLAYTDVTTLSNTVRDLLKNITGSLGNTNIQAAILRRDMDMPQEPGINGYVFRRLIEIEFWHVELATPGPVSPTLPAPPEHRVPAAQSTTACHQSHVNY